MDFYMIVKDATEILGDSRKTRFYACWPDVPRAVWSLSWTCQREHAWLFTSREEAERIAQTKVRGPRTVGVRVIQFRKRA